MSEGRGEKAWLEPGALTQMAVASFEEASFSHANLDADDTTHRERSEGDAKSVKSWERMQERSE